MLWMVLSGSASTRAEEVGETGKYDVKMILFLVLLLCEKCYCAEDEREFDYMRGSEKGPGHWGELKKEWSACKHGQMQSPIDLSCARVKIIPRCQLLLTDYFSSNATIINRGHDIAVSLSPPYLSLIYDIYFDDSCVCMYTVYMRLQIYWKGDAGSIDINGTEFFLKQCHWHSPSEHSINGRKYNLKFYLRYEIKTLEEFKHHIMNCGLVRYDLEMHMVHVSMENKIFVAGAFYKIGHRPDRFLSQVPKI